MEKIITRFKDKIVKDVESLRPDNESGIANEFVDATINSCLKMIELNYKKILIDKELKQLKKERSLWFKFKKWFNEKTKGSNSSRGK